MADGDRLVRRFFGRRGAGETGDARRRRAPTLVQRLRYRFDLKLSRGPSVVISWLGIITVSIIAIAAVALTVFKVAGVNGGHRMDIPQAFWQSVLRVLDTGTFANDVTWPARLFGLIVTLAGIFIAGSLIGLIANALDQRIEELRRGRSLVIETDHTLVLGWSQRVPAIVRELTIANESRAHAAVVVVAERDKAEMEDELHEYIGDTKTTRIVCRSGEPWLPANLALANIRDARSVIVMGGSGDAATVKALLAIRAATAGDDHRFHVVAEVNDVRTALSLKALFGNDLVTVRSDDVVAELTAQACRKQGFSSVFRELLDFDGDELYMAAFPELDGHTYAECQLAFDKCAVVGILDPDGTVRLNPAPSTLLATAEQLIAIAEDDSVFVVSPQPAQGRLLDAEERRRSRDERRILVCGWSELGPRVINELDEFLPDTTTIELLVDPAYVDVAAIGAALSPRNVQIEITVLAGGPEVVAAHAALRSFHEVIVLGYRDTLEVDDADARTLLTLLAFRQVDQGDGAAPVRIVAELLDQRNLPLADAIGADDSIVSDELTSLMLAQLSERLELDAVFRDLFDRSGASIELFDGPSYGAHLASTFADIVVTASAQGHSAIGYRSAAAGVVIVNPSKSAPLQLQREDEVLVVADSAASPDGLSSGLTPASVPRTAETPPSLGA